MILPDSSIWIDHLRVPSVELSRLLDEDEIVGHPLVTIEIALGSIGDRNRILRFLDQLPRSTLASVNELRLLLRNPALHGRGIGLVDLALIASCRLSTSRLWTRDKRLAAVARELDVSWSAAG